MSKNNKKIFKMLPCSVCGNDILFKKDKLKKCPYCMHYSLWDGKEVKNDDWN